MAGRPTKHRMKKLILLGDNGVGKTSLLVRFSHIHVRGIEVEVKTMELGKECDIETADGVLLVYDVTNELSFKHVYDWICKHVDFRSNVNAILVGNKADLVDEDNTKRAVRRNRSQTLGDVFDMIFLEISAKTNKNVEDVFLALASGY